MYSCIFIHHKFIPIVDDDPSSNSPRVLLENPPADPVDHLGFFTGE